jgi:hypothetical protein
MQRAARRALELGLEDVPYARSERKKKRGQPEVTTLLD